MSDEREREKGKRRKDFMNHFRSAQIRVKTFKLGVGAYGRSGIVETP